MKLILNITSLLASLAWVAFMYITALGKAFGSLNPGNNYFNNLPSYVFLSPPIVAIFFIILSRVISDKKISIILAIIPFVWILVCYLVLIGAKTKTTAKIVTEDRENDKKIEVLVEKMAVFSHDYVCKKNPQDASNVLDEFFTYKKESNTMVHIKITYFDEYDIYPLGKVNSDNFELFYDFKQKDLPDCRDINNKTIFDNYNVIYKPEQKEEDYNLSEYYDVAEQHLYGRRTYNIESPQ